MRLLITGGLGLLGKEIARVFDRSAGIRTTDREEWDVTDPAACRREVDGFRPDVVIHCAAWTAVDRAEGEPERTRILNFEGKGNDRRRPPPATCRPPRTWTGPPASGSLSARSTAV